MLNLKSNRISGISNTFKLVIAIAILLSSIFAYIPPVKASIYLSAIPSVPDADTQVQLSWSSVTNASYYALYRNGSQIKLIDTSYDRDYLNYTDTSLTPETDYTYSLRALDSSMNELERAAASASTSRLIKPTGVGALYSADNNTITLSWASNSKAANYSIIKRIDGTTVATVYDSGSYTFVDSEYSTEKVCRYTVTSMDNQGHTSDPSEPATVSSTAYTPYIPSITASMVNGICTIQWASTYDRVYSMVLERSKYNGYSWSSWSVVNLNVPYSNGSISDAPQTAGTYRYRLYVYSALYSGYTNISDSVSRPAAPSELNCTILSSGSILLSWTNDQYNESKLIVERKTGSGDFKQVALLQSNATAYTDSFVLNPNATYTYRVSAYDSDQNISEGKEYSISTGIPRTPSFLNLTIMSGNSIFLKWKDNSSNELGFVIEKKVDTGDYYRIATLSADTTEYHDSGLFADHVYSYRIYSYNPFGASPAYSNEAWHLMSSVPLPPDSLGITEVSSTRVKLTWSYPAEIKSSTVIERKCGSDGEWEDIISISSDITQYTDTGLHPDTQYFYRIKAASGAYVFSTTYPDSRIGIPVQTLMTRPDDTEGYAISPNQIRLSWAYENDITDFIIEKKSLDGSFDTAAYTPSDITTWSDWGLQPNTVYTYRIRARKLDNTSEYSDEIKVFTKFLGVPATLKASAISALAVELNWLDNSTGEAGYEVWKKSGENGIWSKAGSVKYALKYADNSIEADTKYYYKVRAYATLPGGYIYYSAFTDTAAVFTKQPPAPSMLKASILSSNRIRLTWKMPSNSAPLIVERMDDYSGKWQEIASLPAGSISYEDGDIEEYVLYYYRVKSVDTINNSISLSPEIEAITGSPQTPSSSYARALSSTSINVAWIDNSDNELGYIIERKTPNGEYAVAGTVAANTTVFTDTGLQPSTRYYYRVNAYNDSGRSGYTSEASSTTLSKITFDDIADISWAKAEIEYLAGMGAAKSKKDKLFMPNDTMTRAEFTELLMNALSLRKLAVGSFTDVNAAHFAYDEIMAAKGLGIIYGDSNGSFHPDNPVTQEDMAIMISRALSASGKPLPLHNVSILNQYSDKDSISTDALSSYSSLVGEGILPIISVETLRPKDNVTRAEAAVAVFRAIMK